MVSMERKSNLLGVDLIVITTILIAGLKFTFGLENTLDIWLYDESIYLYRGATLWIKGFPASEQAPLYALWYFILSLFESNRIILYYLNYKLTIVLLPMLVYGMLRRNMVSIPISLVISWFLLISRANALTWPRVSHFALFLILATFIFIGYKRSLLLSSLLSSIGALLVSYVRPEYFLAYVLFVLLFAFLFIKDYKKLGKQYLLGLMAYGLFSAIILGVLGLPITGNRSMVAFGQHFSLNWVSWNSSRINPWTNWQEIVSHNFGTVHTIPEAFTKNPLAFLKHITYNLRKFLIITPTLFLPEYFSVNKISVFIVVSLGISLVVIFLFNIRKKSKEDKRLFIPVSLFLLPAFISIILIYPRNHYLLLFNTLTVMIMVILSTIPDFKQRQINFKKLLLLCLTLILVTPHFGQDKQPTQKTNLITIQFIESLKIDQPVNLLEAEGGYNIYLGDNFHRIAEYDKNTGFDYFRRERNVNMIIISDTLLNDSRFKSDPEWQAFLTDYHQFGYLQIVIPNTDRKIIVRSDILPK